MVSQELIELARRATTEEDFETLVRACLRQGIGTIGQGSNTEMYQLYLGDSDQRVTRKSWAQKGYAKTSAVNRGAGVFRIERHLSLCVEEEWIEVVSRYPNQRGYYAGHARNITEEEAKAKLNDPEYADKRL